MNKNVEITVGNIVKVDGQSVGTVSNTKPQQPQLYDTYYVDSPVYTLDRNPTGETKRQYFVYNGVGYASVTGNGEMVTFHE